VPHAGLDIAADIGQDIIVSADGTVTNVSSSSEYGISITVRHDFLEPETRTAMWTKYVHLRAKRVTVGQRVKRGDQLGEVGIFPESDNVQHVHWMLCLDAQCTSTSDPLRYEIGCVGDVGRSTFLTYPVRC
jgi:murein DD-endopeptidase MepM/ murein hydrolase activator NlpD